MLAKLRHFVPQKSLRNIYFGIFASIMNYGSQVWGQFMNEHVLRVIKLQDKAIRIINFAQPHEPCSKLYQKSQILKFQDNININNCTYTILSTDNFQYPWQISSNTFTIIIHNVLDRQSNNASNYHPPEHQHMAFTR